MLKDIIEIVNGFQSSVNIEYDFNDAGKISNFIPTSSALSIINNIITNTDNSNTERAKILTGAYGRGKSHIVLVALSLLYNKDAKIFKKLLGKIKNIDEESYKLINNYIVSNKKLLPVIINGNSGNLTQAFLGALQQALKLYNLDDIMPETHFKAAISTINMWKSNYPDTYEKFKTCIGTNADTFKKELSANLVSSYEKFIEIYPSLTAGSTFNPFVGFNVVDIYDKVNVSLKDKGFNGMYVVYDEFGKYLESSIAVATESETKMLQDFAEKCNREASQQLHLMLICHKDIANYIDSNLSQDKVDGWRGISGRFEHINLSNNFHQMYEIISHAISKNEDVWESFIKEHKSSFDELLAISKHDNFLSGKEEIAVYGCYPLHPITTFILPRLSERIAQNERTLFTYLTANQKNTLREYVKNNEDDFPLITPDHLYNYFEQELRKELNSSEIHKIYSLSSKILAKVGKDTLSSKIIKTIAVIYFVQQFERVAPTSDVLCNIFSYSYEIKDVKNTIEYLINEAYIVYRKNSNDFLCLKETSGIDINIELSNRIEKLKSTMSMEQALNFCAQDNYLYPVRHNESKCLTRYFEMKFISYKNYFLLNNQSVPTGVAGIVYALFFESQDDFNKEIDTTKLGNQEVLIIPKKFSSVENNIFRYIAAVQLREECSAEDEILKNEYDIVASDLENIVICFINDYIRPELNKVEYIYLNSKRNINRKSRLTELLSQICDDVFYKTPIVNNESINKDVLPSVAINSRSKLTTALLENPSVDENLGLIGTGQDVSFMRSTLIQTSILKEKDNQFILDTTTAEESIQRVLGEIKNFFSSTANEGEKSFADLYKILTNAKYGFGMKKGSIPVYIAVILNSFKKDLVLKCNGSEIKINSDSLNGINEKPELYTVLMENWNGDKFEYLNQLSEIFSNHIIEQEKSFNSFTYISNAMIRWYMSLPKCAKEMTVDYSTNIQLDPVKQKFINSLKRNITNSRDFLISELPQIFSLDVSNALANEIATVKHIFDEAKSALLNSSIQELRNIFGGNADESLSSILKNWYDELNDYTLQNVFPNNENAVLSLIKTVPNDETIFTERIGKALSGLRIDDWNQNTFNRFIDELIQFKHTIDDYNTNSPDIISGKKNNHNIQYKIVVRNSEGIEEIKSFDRIEYSNPVAAKLLRSDVSSAVEEIGQSLTEQEKRQILIEILEEMC